MDDTKPDEGAEPGPSPDRLVRALELLRLQIAETRLPLEVVGVQEARRDQVRLLAHLDDYVLPRVRQLDAPLLAVVGGSTGAGKSTLVNSLLREKVSQPGVLRPTTRSPVLVHNPEDERWFMDRRILPGLARVTGAAEEPSGAGRIGSVRLVPSEVLAPGLALLDAPDIDSVVEANREMAGQLLAAADLWVFVTTAARYADAVPWDLLRGAAQRGTSVTVVLDRVPPEALHEVRADLAHMLGANDLGSAPLFTVVETTLDERGLLPERDVAPIRQWLVGLATDAKARSVVIKRTLSGAVAALGTQVPDLASAAADQQRTAVALNADLDSAFKEVDRHLQKGLSDGSLLRGEVLARWQEFVGTGEFFKGLESALGRIRDRIGAALRGRPAPVEPLGEALHSGVTALVVAQGQEAVELAVRRWHADPAGSALLAAHPYLEKPSPQFEENVERTIRLWQTYILELVRSEGQARRSQARLLSMGTNAVGVVLMVVVFASTAFIPTGAEVGVGVGSALVGQRLLEAVFGDQAVRSLAAKAREELQRRVDDVLAQEKDRLAVLLRNTDIDPQAQHRLLASLQEVQEAR